MIPPRVSSLHAAPLHILVVRLGSMGDVIAALPAVASLKHSIPHSKITWVIDPKWSLLLEGNPYVDSVVHLDRRTFTGLRHAWRELRASRFDFAVDFQGLVKSALVATLARPERIFGFNADYARESPASWFYSTKVPIRSYHAVERNLDLAAAAGASNILRTFPLPPGECQAKLPEGDFVLASPLAGWGAKQWPLEYYAKLADRLERECGMPLVLDAPHPLHVPGTRTHVSTLAGLIYATRRATAVVGLDSGPLHLAAALSKPGVAIYGPTDPLRHGPYGGTIRVLRSPDAVITYRRTAEPDASMREIAPDRVFDALAPMLAAAGARAAHAGAPQARAMQTQAAHTGAAHTGAAHTGALHTGAVHTGAAHTGAAHTGALHTGALHKKDR